MIISLMIKVLMMNLASGKARARPNKLTKRALQGKAAGGKNGKDQ